MDDRPVRNYNQEVLTKVSDDTLLGNYRVGPCLVVGLVVEAALVMEFRAWPALPVTLARQRTHHHQQVEVHQVLLTANGAPQSVLVKVFPRDAELALKVALAIVDRLGRTSWKLTVLSADHSSPHLPGSQPHDLLLRACTDSAMDGAIFTTEIKCREVVTRDPATHNWRTTYEAKASELWDAEWAHDASTFAARILVFVEFTRPSNVHDGNCHSHAWVPETHLHASIRWGGAARTSSHSSAGWVFLFQWQSNKQRFWPHRRLL